MLEGYSRSVYYTLLVTSLLLIHAHDHGQPQDYIVQADTVAAARQFVSSVGAATRHELPIIRAVTAPLSEQQRKALESRPRIRIYADSMVRSAGFFESLMSRASKAAQLAAEGSKVSTAHRELIGAERLLLEGYTGSGVTVAVLDTGVWSSNPEIKEDLFTRNKIVAEYNARNGKQEPVADKNGHGTHLSSIIGSPRFSSVGLELDDDDDFDIEFDDDGPQVLGIAPNANLVNIAAFDKDGVGTYSDVIRGLNWLVNVKDLYNIRVVNLSFSAPPQSYYWDDPINQAVMAVWQSGIVVVSSAGNTGPEPMTIGVPGNVPYIITVGAMTDNYTPDDRSDDRIASFSSAGPTIEAFVKPELVAPGGHIVGIMDRANHKIAQQKSHWEVDPDLYEMSGTSQSAAVVSGAVALLLEAKPWLSPDDVKCQLMSAAEIVTRTKKEHLAYSVFQQGAGLIDIYAAVKNNNRTGCANTGLDINLDLTGQQHYQGPANMNEDGEYTISPPPQSSNPEAYDALRWDGSYHPIGNGLLWNDGVLWNNGLLWNDGALWNDSVVWSNGLLWNDSAAWNTGLLWNDLSSRPAAIDNLVEQE